MRRMLECNNCEARYGSLAPDPTQRQGLPMSAMHPVATKILPRRDWSLCAMCGRLRVGKSFLHVCSIGRCSHVFGLLARFTCVDGSGLARALFTFEHWSVRPCVR